MNFKDFKKKANDLSTIVEKMNSAKSSYQRDERIWMVTKDSAGNGSAIIRFLPQKDLEKSPFQKLFRHSTKINGKWLIEPCPQTIGEKCPICGYSSEIWDTGGELARQLWRKTSYIANILVVDDPANPENNGQVKLFKFGKSIYNIISDVVAPEDADEEPINVFDFDEGLNFKLKLVQKSGYNNYDKSKFIMKPSQIADGDFEEQEKIYNQIYDLDEFIDPKLFKSEADLLAKLNRILKTTISTTNVEEDSKAEAPSINTSTVDDTANTSDAVEDGDDFNFDDLLADD